MDVARVDECIIIARGVGVVNGGFQRVGEAVAKHPSKFLIVFQQFLYLLDFLVDHVGTEQTLFLSRTARHVGRTLLANALDVLLAVLSLSHSSEAYHCQTANNS